MDALLCSKDAGDSLRRMFSECSRVLMPGGVFLLITLGAPAQRLALVNQPEFGWDVQVGNEVSRRHRRRNGTGVQLPGDGRAAGCSAGNEVAQWGTTGCDGFAAPQVEANVRTASLVM